MDRKELLMLQKTAVKVRKDILTAVYSAKSGHPGGSLSFADILTYLYFKEMNVDPKNPKKADRDRFVLSKGHAAPVLYSVLAEKGYFSTDELVKLRKPDGMLQGHPDMKGTPGVDMSTGSLGLGISAACGIAIAAKKANASYRVYCGVGDGELAEGQVWEASMFAGHYKLDNLTIFVDINGLQIDGCTKDVMDSSPVDKKFEAFNFNVIKIDGHNFEEIEKAVEAAKACKGKPTAIIAKTVKGKGVSLMENRCEWHGTAPNEEQYKLAMADLEKIEKGLEG